MRKNRSRNVYNIYIAVVVFVLTFIYFWNIVSFKKKRPSFKNKVLCKFDTYFDNHKHEFKNLDMTVDHEEQTPQYKLIKKYVNGGSYFVDIGVNRGDFTKVLLSFEPSANVDFFDVIERFVDRAKTRFRNYNVFGYHLAMTDGTGPEYIDIKGRASWKNDNSFFTGASALVRNDDHDTVLEHVKTSSIDKFYFDDNTVIDFLKIDTEGFDARVLHGARKMLGKKRIKFIFFENNKMQLDIGDNMYSTIQYMSSLDYDCYLFGSKKSIYLNDLCVKNSLFDSTMTLNIFCE